MGYTPRGGAVSQNTPEESAAAAEAARKAMDEQRKANQGNPAPPIGANFEMSPAALEAYRAAQGRQAAAEGTTAARAAAIGQGSIAPTVAEGYAAGKARDDQAAITSAEQARRGGVETADANMGAGGITGFFDPNAKVQTTHYTAGHMENTTLAGNRARLDSLADAAANRGTMTMQGANMGGGATIATAAQDQTRARQNALLDQLMAASNGQGPSAAQQQLKMGADRNMANALAMAAAQGTPGAARQAAFQRAAATQDLAGQSAILRAQEINDARGLLGQVAQGTRAQDIGLATDQAGLQQQAQATNAQLAQDTAKTNLLAGIEQQKQKDALVQSYVAQGMSLDQAQYQAELQQAQFNAQLLAQQSAADKGVSMQGAQQGGQMVSAGVAALGAMAATASDKRAKNNIEDGDASIEAMLDDVDQNKKKKNSGSAVGDAFTAFGKALSGPAPALPSMSIGDNSIINAARSGTVSDRSAKTNVDDGDAKIEAFIDALNAKDFDYKNPAKHGEGRRTGVMAQDAERSELGKRMVTEAPDGTKMLDVGKGLSLSLAALANINKRLRELEDA